MTHRIREFCSPREAHEAVIELYQQVLKPYTRRGARGRLIFESINHHKRHELRKMFHGPILADFAEQVWLPDPETRRKVRYAPIVWKEHLKDLFCPMKENPRTKKLERSTELLNDDEFSVFLEQVRAYGVVDLGVEFTEREEA
jgi:hypothetical protein